MKAHHPVPFRFVIPLPSFVLRPLTAAVIAAVHVYLAAGHLWHLMVGDVQWTHCWKGFGALAAPTYSRRWRRGGLPEAKVGGALVWTLSDEAQARRFDHHQHEELLEAHFAEVVVTWGYRKLGCRGFRRHASFRASPVTFPKSAPHRAWDIYRGASPGADGPPPAPKPDELSFAFFLTYR